MDKNEYYSNTYKSIISNKIFHFIIIFIEYYLTFIIQIFVFTRKINKNEEEQFSLLNYVLIILKGISNIPIILKLIIIILVFILIQLYYFIFNKFSFKNSCLFNKIIINIFEIFIFRLFFILVCHFYFSNTNVILLICIIISIPMLTIIIKSFMINHLYYFSPHFLIYPYDYYSSFCEIIHFIEKILICICLENSIDNLNVFIFILAFFMQIICLFSSLYIFYFKSYYIMNNIFLNKSRFSFIIGRVLTNSIMILLGKNNIKNSNFFIIVINIYLIFFIIIQIFYNPYEHVYFGTDDNIDNLYFYFYIIDQNKNDSYILEEKLEKHYSSCKNCDLCKKLQKYLIKKFNSKKLYTILYKDIGILSKIMNELIQTILIYGKDAIKNNSFYLINIIYCYYVHFNKKNYVLSLNLKIIYEIINEENQNILDNHLLSTKQIFLINEFLNKADKILDKIQETVLENYIKKKINNFFDLFNKFLELKNNKFKSQLYYNKNEGIINFFRYISICTMIYEEIFNVTLSNGGLSLKENQVFLDDLSHKNELNQIIIQLDLLNFENKIIYILGEFAKYKDKALCKLFPNIFRSKQLLIMKNKIINSKNFQNKDDSKENKDYFFNNNKEIGGQYIDFQCVIYDTVEKKKTFKMIYLRLHLIYPLEMTKSILLAGIYSVEKNVIITLDKSTKERHKEFILNNVENKNEEENIYNSTKNNKSLITFKKNEKYYKNQKLIFINKYNINPNNYNIYYIYYPEKQKTIKNERNSIRLSSKNLFLDMESKMMKNDSDGNQNFNFLIQSSTSASTFTQISNDKQNFKKRNKDGKKDKQNKNNFHFYQFGLIIFGFLILFFQIIYHISIKNYYLNRKYYFDILMTFKNYYGVFNIQFTFILSASCLGNESKGEHCKSTFGYYQDFYNNLNSINNLNLTEFILAQNLYCSNQLKNAKKTMLELLSDSKDEDLINLFNSQVETYYLSQNFDHNKNDLNVLVGPYPFLETLEYMTSAFIVMSSNIKNLNDIVYIINKPILKGMDDFPFINVKANSQLSQYQIYFYYLIFNYPSFMQALDLISRILAFKNNIYINSYIKLVEIFILINLILYLIFNIILSLYIQNYFRLIADLLNEVQNKMNIKNDNISVKDFYLQKIEKLKIIISLYKQNMYQAIVDLNFIYDNYKKFMEEKNKELSKYLKKEKYLNDTNKNNSYNKKGSNNIKVKYIINASNNKRYLYYILASFVFSICISLGIYIMWLCYEAINIRINSLIKIHGNLSDNAYKLISYYQLMIYYNLTVEDINIFQRFNISNGENLFSNIYTSIENIYDAKKLMSKLSEFNLDNIDSYYNYTCKTYYDYLFKNNVIFNNIDEKYKDFLIYVCEQSSIFKYNNNYKQIFSLLFENILIGVNKINVRSYKGLINYLKDEYFPKITVTFLTVYYYAFEILGLQLQRKSYQKILSLLGNFVNISFIIYYATSSTFILIVIFGYIWKINTNYNKIHELKKVFKVCNKKE